MVDQPKSSTSLGSQVFMMQVPSPILIATQIEDYQATPKQTVEKEATNIPSTSPLSSSGPLHTGCPNSESVI